jgi:2,3-bisphosphoglycerate-dependent phosphoglycerate mutase
MRKRVVIIRHGESVFNKENRFTGWQDVALTDKGLREARQAGNDLSDKGYKFDVVYTSRL